MTVLHRLLLFVAWPLLYVYLKRDPHARTRILVVSGNTVVGLKNWIGSGRWALPGGGRRGEESSRAGALRELREETGIVAHEADLHFLVSGTVTTYGLAYRYECFVLQLIDKLPLRRQWYEVARLQWLPLETIQQHEAEPDTWLAVTTWRQNQQRTV
ncbi:MAG TPA: NUDIX hydrolase [Candidatus Saccharimonadales bacterium]|nr:NUDIX hydrolase [Candidatus Saccharimonadales bacterium]